MRQPLEDQVANASRAQGALTFPASLILVGAMNPCPCGYYGDDRHPCTGCMGSSRATSNVAGAASAARS